MVVDFFISIIQVSIAVSIAKQLASIQPSIQFCVVSNSLYSVFIQGVEVMRKLAFVS